MSNMVISQELRPGESNFPSMIPRYQRLGAQVTVDDVLSADPENRAKHMRIQSSKLPHPRNNLRQI